MMLQEQASVESWNGFDDQFVALREHVEFTLLRLIVRVLPPVKKHPPKASVPFYSRRGKTCVTCRSGQTCEEQTGVIAIQYDSSIQFRFDGMVQAGASLQ